MNAPSIPRVKRILRRCAKADAERLTATALTFASTAEVEAFLNGEIAAHFADSFD
jgi:phosphotransferase system enzyme I (PtsI)